VYYVSILPHCQNCLLDTRPALFRAITRNNCCSLLRGAVEWVRECLTLPTIARPHAAGTISSLSILRPHCGLLLCWFGYVLCIRSLLAMRFTTAVSRQGKATGEPKIPVPKAGSSTKKSSIHSCPFSDYGSDSYDINVSLLSHY
jgi:hypothetical protein